MKHVIPGCVHQYNKYMGGVNLSDRRIYYFQESHSVGLIGLFHSIWLHLAHCLPCV